VLLLSTPCRRRLTLISSAFALEDALMRYSAFVSFSSSSSNYSSRIASTRKTAKFLLHASLEVVVTPER